MSRAPQSGFSLVEGLISLAVVAMLMSGVSGVLIQNARINKSQKLIAGTQANARGCLSIVVQKLRSAGWDPMNAGINSLTFDPDLTDSVSQIEIFSDLDEDGLTDSSNEQILVRHSNGVVEWRSSNDTTQPFDTVAVDISNDADGDGTPEPMFVPDSTTDPTRITVTVTAESPVADPMSGEAYRYTVSSDVILRKLL